MDPPAFPPAAFRPRPDGRGTDGANCLLPGRGVAAERKVRPDTTVPESETLRSVPVRSGTRPDGMLNWALRWWGSIVVIFRP